MFGANDEAIVPDGQELRFIVTFRVPSAGEYLLVAEKMPLAETLSKTEFADMPEWLLAAVQTGKVASAACQRILRLYAFRDVDFHSWRRPVRIGHCQHDHGWVLCRWIIFTIGRLQKSCLRL